MNSVAEADSELPPTASTSVADPKPLSKNAQKKLARAARIAEQKKERRAAEKERRKEKKREQAAKRAAGELDDAEDEERRKRARTEGPKRPFHARIIVDLGFDDMMTDNVGMSIQCASTVTLTDTLWARVSQEIKSLTSQLAYTYSANKKASQPFSALLFTSVDGRTYTRLEGMSNAAYRRWQDTEWWQESYEKLWLGGDGAAPASTDSETGQPEVAIRKDDAAEDAMDAAPPEPAADHHQAHSSKSLMSPQRAAQDTVVYLTADSEDELTELKEGETYIIGGICDHNRYKVSTLFSTVAVPRADRESAEPLLQQSQHLQNPLRAPPHRDLPRRTTHAQGPHRQPDLRDPPQMGGDAGLAARARGGRASAQVPGPRGWKQASVGDCRGEAEERGGPGRRSRWRCGGGRRSCA